jgi:hypothetical protein
MGANFRMWWRRGQRHSMPLVHRDIKRFSCVREASHVDVVVESDRRCGRFAKSDQVATCLLRRNYATAMPVRREVQVARNRRRLKLAFVATLVWWGLGRFLA